MRNLFDTSAGESHPPANKEKTVDIGRPQFSFELTPLAAERPVETLTNTELLEKSRLSRRQNFTAESIRPSPCRCARCRSFGETPRVVFVAVCEGCWESERDRIERNRRERKMGVRG